MSITEITDGVLSGQTIGGDKYTLVRLLGVGGMGAVYEAQNNWTQRRVAIKLMRPEFATDEVAASRFLQEARSAVRVPHPNIVDVLDMGREPDGLLYIVQEYLTGCDLRRRLDEGGRLSPAEAVALIVPVADALAAAHASGVLHRDLKPDNIFLAQDRAGRIVPKVIDFGISKMDHEGDRMVRGHTRQGETVGTPHYMSPEQMRSEGRLDGRADVWSLGAVLYELLTGRPPYDGTTYTALVAKILTEHPAPIETLVPDLPPELVQIVHSALRHERDLRPDMVTFRDALANWASNNPGAVTAAPGTGASAPPASSMPGAKTSLGLGATMEAVPSVRPPALLEPVTEPTLVPRSSRSSRSIWLVGIAGVVILAVGAGALALSIRSSPANGASPQGTAAGTSAARTPTVPPITQAGAQGFVPVPIAPAPDTQIVEQDAGAEPSQREMHGSTARPIESRRSVRPTPGVHHRTGSSQQTSGRALAPVDQYE